MITLGEQRRLREYTDALIQDSIRVTRGATHGGLGGRGGEGLGLGGLVSGDINDSSATANSNDALALALRSGFERGLHSSVHDSLLDAKKRKENDINKVCSRHYTDFLTSVADMLKMKSSSSELRTLVEEVNSDVRQTGSGLVTVLTNLERVAKEKEGTVKVLSSLVTCRDMAVRMVSFRKQIKEGSHYAAMESLEFMQKELVSLRSYTYLNPLLVCLQIWLPMAKGILLSQTRYEAFESLLYNITLTNDESNDPAQGGGNSSSGYGSAANDRDDRGDDDESRPSVSERSRLIGETLLRRKAKHVKLDNKLNVSLTKMHHRNRVKITSLSSTISSISVETCEPFMMFSSWCKADEFDCIIPSNFIEEPSKEGEDIIRSLQARLAPLFKSIYMHLVLLESSVFSKEYRDARDKVLSMLFEEAEEQTQLMGFATILPSLIAKITGFFFVETNVRFYGNFSSTLYNNSSSSSNSSSGGGISHDKGVVSPHTSGGHASHGNSHQHSTNNINNNTGGKNHNHNSTTHSSSTTNTNITTSGSSGNNSSRGVGGGGGGESKQDGSSVDVSNNNSGSGSGSGSGGSKVEATIDVFSSNELSILWDKNVSFLYTIIMRNSEYFRTPEQILQLKEDLLLLVEVANDGFFQGNLRTSGIYDIIKMLWGRFEKGQNMYLTENFKIILEDCEFRAMHVTSEEVMNRELKPFNLHKSQSLEPTSSSSMADNNGLGSGNRDSISGSGGMNRSDSICSISSVQRRQSINDTLDTLEDDLMFGDSSNANSIDNNDNNTNVSSSNNDNNGDEGLSSSGIRKKNAGGSSGKSSGNGGYNNRNDDHDEYLSGGPNSPYSLTSSSRRRSIKEFERKAFTPMVFPFSEAVPKISKQIFLLITRYLLFAAKNPLLGSRGESLCASVRVAFCTIADIFQQELILGGQDTPLSKAVQVSIDCMVLSGNITLTVNTLMERMFAHLHWFDSVNSHLPAAMQASKDALLRVSLNAQDVIVELLTSKVKDLLDSLCFIDFNPTTFTMYDPRLNNSNLNIMDVISGTQAHDVINGVIAYLNVTFMGFAYLPCSAREVVHFTCCSRISQDIVAFISSPAVITTSLGFEQVGSGKVKEINILALFAFEKDIAELEKFSSDCHIPDLHLCFKDLKDLITATILVVKHHVSSDGLNNRIYPIIDDSYLRQQLYPKLDIVKLANLIDKLVATPYSPINNILPRIDKSILKTITKRIRSKK